MAALKPRRTRSTATPPRAFRRNKSAQDIGVLETRRAKRQQFLRKRGIYLLPNAFTTAALFCGFFAVVQAMNVRFEIAAIAIFVAMVLDGMDGRVARMTHTQSAFGEQFDSLSDMVSFGVAPALVMYEWILKDLGRWGWLAAFVYCSGAALRLARFNTNVGVVDKRYFQGLPSPAAAALIAGFVWLATDNRVPLKLVWRCHDGVKRAVLQRQGARCTVPCAVRRRIAGRGGVRARVVGSAVDVVRLVRVVRFFRLRMVGVHGHARPAESGQIV